jgi:hypothetical protein
LHALDHGYTYGLLWLAGVVILLGVVALFIGYTAEQVARAQEVQKAVQYGDTPGFDEVTETRSNTGCSRTSR